MAAIFDVVFLRNYLPKKYAIHNTLITTFGLKDSEYMWDFVKVLTLDDLLENRMN